MPAVPRSAPRFRAITDTLRMAILNGTLAEHDALPSERTIAEEHGVSRMTARRALEALEAEGLAYSENRRGRFVSPQRLTYDVSRKVSFVAEAEATGLDLEIEPIDSATIRADASLAAKMEVEPGTPLYAYTRLFRSRGHAIFVEREVVIAGRFPDFLTHDLRQSTTRLLEQHYDTCAHIGDIVIRMRAMDGEEARLLALAPNHAGIELEQVIRDDVGSAFCMGRQMWRGELAQFSARAMLGG